MAFEIKDQNAYERGRLEARRDVVAGRLIFRMHGRPAEWVATWRSLLHREYGVEVLNSGCLVSDEIISYAVGYNEVSEAEIARRFGEDRLRRTGDEAQALALGGGVLRLKNFENNRAEVEAEVNSLGWAKCRHCGVSFKVTSAQSWDGRRHQSCQQRLRLRQRAV